MAAVLAPGATLEMALTTGLVPILEVVSAVEQVPAAVLVLTAGVVAAGLVPAVGLIPMLEQVPATVLRLAPRVIVALRMVPAVELVPGATRSPVVMMALPVAKAAQQATAAEPGFPAGDARHGYTRH